MEVAANILWKAERVLAEHRETLIPQMAGTDWKAAERMSQQFDRLDAICEEKRRREADGTSRMQVESQLEAAMRKMGEIAADFVFEHEGSNTKEMAAFFAGLGYAGGDRERAAVYADNLRSFGYHGKIERAFWEAGELSDATIPVMEAFHQLQENFMLREDGTEADALSRDYFDFADVKRFKKACGTYLEMSEGKSIGEVQAVTEASRQLGRAEAILKMSRKEKLTYSDMMSQEKKENDIKRGSSAMNRTQSQPKRKMQYTFEK